MSKSSKELFIEDKPESRSPCQRPRSPAVLSRCARCAQLPTARIEAVLQQLPLIPSLICLILTPNADFSSRLTLSLPLTHAHTSSVPCLPPSLLLSGERQLDGTIHLQERSIGLVLHQVPGSLRSRVSNVEELLGRFGAEGREVLSSAVLRPPDT